MTLWQVFDRHALRLLKVKKMLDEELERVEPSKGVSLGELRHAESFLVTRAGRLRATIEEADCFEKNSNLKEIAIEVRRTAASALAMLMMQSRRVSIEICEKELRMLVEEELYGDHARAVPGVTVMNACELSVSLAARLAAIKPISEAPAVSQFSENLRKFIQISDTLEKPSQTLTQAVRNFQTSQTILAELDVPLKGLNENLKNAKEALKAKLHRISVTQANCLQPSAVRLDALAGTENVASEISNLMKAVGKAEADNIIDYADAIKVLSDRLKKLNERDIEANLPMTSDLKRLEREVEGMKERLRKVAVAEYPVIDCRLQDAMEASLRGFEDARSMMGKI